MHLPGPRWRLVVLALVGPAIGCGDENPQQNNPPRTLQEQITLPPGFHIDVWADGIVRPRSLALGDDGTVFVGTYFFTKGATSPIYALKDTNNDHRADRVWELRNNMGTPNGIDFHDGTLYVVDEHRVMRVDAVQETLDDPVFETIYSGLPSRASTDSATNVGHWWRYLVYGPDDKLYITVGTRWSLLAGAHSANDIGDDPQYSTIVRMSPTGADVEIFADGVRNSVGLAFHPTTNELWFTDNGPSWPFEDPRFYDIPPDELNRAPVAGMHFGFPYIHGRLSDWVSGDDAPPNTTPPAHEFLAHSATLGLEFYTGTMFPQEYRDQIFVAEHGIEATTPAPLSKLHGDRISLITLDEQSNVIAYRPFAEGFRQGSNANYTRRPVDLLVMPDGSLLVSDDEAWVIYRIWYGG